MTGVVYIIPYITAFSLSQQSWLHTLIQIHIVSGRGGGRYKTGRDAVLSSFFLIEGAGSEKLSCWAFIKIKYIENSLLV